MAKINKLTAYGEDAIIRDIREGLTLTDIAKKANASIGWLSEWISENPERSARVREARKTTAQMWEEKAVKGIEDASDPFELARAKELAHHYRWRASKINPRDFGDRVDVGNADGKPFETTDSAMATRLATIMAQGQQRKQADEPE